MKNSNETMGNRTRDLPVCSVVKMKCTVLNYKEIIVEKEELQATDSIRAVPR